MWKSSHSRATGPMESCVKYMLIVSLLWDGFKKGAWAPIPVFVEHTFFTQIVRLPRIVPNVDVLEHFIGGVAIAYFFYYLLAPVRSMLFQDNYEVVTQNILIF